MQVFPEQILNIPVISLQTGGRIAMSSGLLIDSSRLAVVAIICSNPKDMLLLPLDIRQLAPQGILVNHEEALAEPEDIVRIVPLYRERFNPIGIGVSTDMGRHIGKLETYTVNTEDFLVQKLHVRRPVWQSLTGASAIIDRQQVVDVTKKSIIVKDTEEAASAIARTAEQPNLQI